MRALLTRLAELLNKRAFTNPATKPIIVNFCFIAPRQGTPGMVGAMPQVRGCGRVRFFDGEPIFEAVAFSDGTVTAKTFSVAVLPLNFRVFRGICG